jgi:hypothetical protein
MDALIQEKFRNEKRLFEVSGIECESERTAGFYLSWPLLVHNAVYVVQ